jgi:hypothetical protein
VTGHDDDSSRYDAAGYLDDPALRATAEQVHRAMRAPAPPADFRDRLRAQLVAARAEAIATAQPQTVPSAQPQAVPSAQPQAIPSADRPTQPGGGTHPGGVNRPRGAARFARLRRRPVVLAWAGAVVSAVAVAVVLVAQGIPGLTGPSPVSVGVVADAMGAVSVDPAGAVRLRFSQSLDHTATEAALRVAPYTDVDKNWQGNTVTLVPRHGFAPNTPYLITIDHRGARTAGGAPLTADLHVVFGTAPVAGVGPDGGAQATLGRARVAGAGDGSEAVVTADGALLLTAAQPGRTTGNRSGLVRIDHGNAVKVSTVTDAICVSRSGNSIAFLAPAGSGTDLVFADRSGNPERRVQVPVDQGSPLGWIGDNQVSFVKGGQLSAMDRDGHIVALPGPRLDAAHDRVDLAPGGRYAYLQPSGASGQLLDLVTGKGHSLPGITGDPAFSADGATVVWVDGSGSAPRIASAASGGGPVLTARLPVAAGDEVSDLSVAPDGSRFVYSVTRPDHSAELRLAALPDGHTVAVSTGAAGASPNWAPSGRLFTVLTSGAGGAQIDAVTVPATAVDGRAAFEASAARFADAQIGGDAEAQRSLAAPGVAPPAIPRVVRAAVLWVLLAPDGTATARVRLSADARPDDLTTTEVEETLTLGPRPGGGSPLIRGVVADPPARVVPSGPRLNHLDTDAVPGAILATFDSDLDPASVSAAVGLSSLDGQRITADPRYDAATRTVTLRPTTPSTGPVVVSIGTGLRDLVGQHPKTELRITVPPGS